jgi:hypothetical protein
MPINQMNACAGDNSRAKMIPIFANTFNGSLASLYLVARIPKQG